MLLLLYIYISYVQFYLDSHFPSWALAASLSGKMDHLKGNPLEIPIWFKFLKNVLISRVYEQFSRNYSAMAPERLSEKISNF